MSPKPLNHIAVINIPVSHVFSILTAVCGLPDSLQTKEAAQTQSTTGTHRGISF